MKNIILIAALFIITTNFITAQSLNWNTTEQREGSQVYLNLGYDFGMTTQFGFAKKINFQKPVLLLTDLSIPMGNELDDYKFRIGAQMNVLNFNNFKTSVQYISIVRRHETNLVRQIGIGQLVSMTTGIYKAGWHAAFVLGYDGSVATHAKHSEEMQEIYSDIQDAWYKNTGGQWHYGFEGSKKLGERMELNLSVGATNAKGKDGDALLPYYARVGGVFWLN